MVSDLAKELIIRETTNDYTNKSFGYQQTSEGVVGSIFYKKA